MLEEYVKDNITHVLCKVSHSQLSQMQRKPNFDVKKQTKSMDRERSRAPGQGVCLKGMSRTITVQGCTLAAITDANPENQTST